MKETPPNPSFQLKYHTKQTPGVHIKLFFTRTPLRRELQALFYREWRSKSLIQKSQKEHVTKDFSNRTLTSSRPI